MTNIVVSCATPIARLPELIISTPPGRWRAEWRV